MKALPTLARTLLASSLALAMLSPAAQAATTASWSMNDGGNLCNLCSVTTGPTETEVSVVSAVTGMTLDMEQFNLNNIADQLDLFDGTTLVATLDTSTFGFTDLAADSFDFSGARPFQNFAYLRSGYLSIQSDQSFNRVVFSGDDTITIANMSGASPVPEPSMAWMSALGLGLLALRRPTRRA